MRGVLDINTLYLYSSSFIISEQRTNITNLDPSKRCSP